MSDLACNTNKKIIRPNGKKAIARLEKDLSALINRAPIHPQSEVRPTLLYDAKESLNALIKTLKLLYQ